MPPKRMTANPLKPARHRPGKRAGDSSSDSDEASDDEQQNSEAIIPPPPKAASAGRIASNLGKVDLDARRNEADAAEQRRLVREKAERQAAEEGFVTEEEEEDSDNDQDDEDGEDSSSSEEEESSSEDEAPRRLMIRPKFIPKSQRGKPNDTAKAEEEARIAQEEARKKAADDLVEEQIKKDLAARAAGKKHWDDDDNNDSDVDTTDGIDPEAEEAAWRVRELKRLKDARSEIEVREAELAEVERRRNLTEEERQAEDEAFLAKQKEDKDSKGKMSYMQRYFHRGAFFQEETEAAGLLQRDIMGSRIQDDVRNREALPEYLQKRDMTKLGRKGGTKYRDMKSEDTGSWGQLDGRDRRDGGRSRFEGDDRFRPDDDRFKPDERDAKGANAMPLGERRQKREREERHGGDDYRRGGGGRDGRDYRRSDDHERGDRYKSHRSRSRDNDRRRRRSCSRSRSRSHRRNCEYDGGRRKRSTSGDRYDSDKRRRF